MNILHTTTTGTTEVITTSTVTTTSTTIEKKHQHQQHSKKIVFSIMKEPSSSSKVFETTFKEHMIAFVAFLLSLCIIRVPIVSEMIITMFQFLNSETRYQSPPLSIVCWIIHYPLQIIGLELAKSTLKSSSSSSGSSGGNNIVHALGIMFVINYVQGWLILMSHSVAGGYNVPLETTFDGIGAILLRVTVFSMGIFGLEQGFFLFFPTRTTTTTTKKHNGNNASPSWTIGFPLVVYGVITKRITFENMNGRILSTGSLLAIFCSKELHLVTKMGYFMTCLTPILFPGDFVQSNVTHSLAASYLNVAVFVMLVGIKLMKNKNNGSMACSR